MDYSFYGGRPGQSMVIVKYFSSIEEMNTAFNQGDSYTEVGYGECVLIDTDDPRNLENGRLYKRGLQGAEYLGTIKGPAGYPPHMMLDDYDKIKAEGQRLDNMYKENPESVDYLAKTGEFDFQYQQSDQNDLIPGKYNTYEQQGETIKTIKNFNDTIKWAYVSLRELDEQKGEEETTIKIGFKIPYHVFDWEATSISPYDNRIDDKKVFEKPLEYNDLIRDLEAPSHDKMHPFYSDLKVKIPHGVKGDSLKGLKVITGLEYKQIKAQEGSAVNPGITDHAQWESDYPGLENDDNRKILVYEYYDYRNSEEGARITKYIADYNMIDIDDEETGGIEVTTDGTIIIKYTHADTKTYPNLIRWIEEISLNEDTGILDITYNTPLRDDEIEQSHWYQKDNKAHYKTHLRWVEDISLADNGEVTLHFTQGDKDITTKPNAEVINEADPIKWIKNITLAADGTVRVQYNTDMGTDAENYDENTDTINYSTFAKALNWITNVDLNPSSGNLTVTFNNNNLFNGEYQVGLEWIKDVRLEDGILTFTFTQKEGKLDAEESFQLDWIKDISIAQNGEVTLTHSYRESEPPNNFKQSILENKLQWVEDIDVTPKGDLAIYYNTDAVFETYGGENISLDGYLDASTKAKSIYELYNDKKYLYQYQLSHVPEVPNIIKENIVYGTFIGQTGTNIENVIFDYAEGALKTTQLLYDLGTGAGLVYSPRNVLIKNNSNILDRNFKWVEKIDITEDGEVISNYNYTNDAGQKASIIQADKLTWIKGMRLDTQDYQLIAINNHGEEIRLGSTKVDSTLSIAFNIRPDETFISETENIQAGFAVSDNLTYLNKKFPKGLDISVNGDSINEEWMKGKIITVGPDSLEEIDQRKNFYAFDYNRNQWYYLGTLDGMGALKYQQVAEREKEENINAAMERLDIGGVCYITTQRPNNAATTLDFILDLEG